MMPNLDPRALKSMMDRMGIKSTEVTANKVIIDCLDKKIIIDDPQVMRIDAQGTVSFQISGNISEEAQAEEKIEITEDDIKVVMDQTKLDYESSKLALEEADGDIAEAIMNLSKSE